ncbi:MAG: PocR ligand-binding domain-containing protein [Anaerolineales bacterium]|nr:PocR ligand-binding domain-containing protein [Anaerolineales bacterium]MBK8825027.1 PocR ligand-binding domain-containing protein [Anaerolineales bacterium]
MENLLTAKQVQELLNVDRTTIYRMLKDGRLTGVKVGQHWRFSARDVNDVLEGTVRLNETEVPLSGGILPLHCMQPVQDVFAEIAQVGAVTADKNGNALTRISNSCDFCKLIMGSDEGRVACLESWGRLVAQEDAAPEFTTCHAGLQYARARIEVRSELIAILIAGQFYIQKPETEEENLRIEALARKYHISQDLLMQASKQISVLGDRKIPQISGWLERVASTFEQISSERVNLMGRLRQIAEMSIIE